MRTSAACQKTLLCMTILVLVVEISTANRTRRQIKFEAESENCRTPDNRPGRCIRLTSCRALAETDVLRRYICGFEGDVLKVCCPQQPRAEETTSRPIFTATRPTRRMTARPDDSRDREQPVLRPNALMDRPGFLPSSCGIPKNSLPRVVGGSKAEKGSWPWMAVLFIRRFNGSWIADCGGSLVTNQHVVTATHCVVSGRRNAVMDTSRLRVRLGAYDLSQPDEPDAIDVEVESVRKHEAYEGHPSYKNDIAVLKLKSPVTFTEAINPICLPYDSLNGEDLSGKRSIVVGFGTTAFEGEASDVMMQAMFYIQSEEVCKRAHEPEMEFTHVFMCAGMMDGSKDACQGDSGGPLLAVGKNRNYYLVGIVSSGKECGLPGYPGIYTRVTAFLDWLSIHLSN